MGLFAGGGEPGKLPLKDVLVMGGEGIKFAEGDIEGMEGGGNPEGGTGGEVGEAGDGLVLDGVVDESGGEGGGTNGGEAGAVIGGEELAA